MSGIKIDVGAVIFQEIGIRETQTATSLPFPSLITTLCKAAQVPVDERKDKTGKETQVIDITRLSDAVIPPVVPVQEQTTEEPSDSQPTVTPQVTVAASSTSEPASKSTTVQPATAIPAVSKLGLLAQHANAKVDQLLKTFPTLIKQALTPMQASVTELQQQQSKYEDRLQQLELRVEKIERGEISGLPGLKEEVASMKTELQKMQNLEFDLSPLLPTDGDQATGTAPPDLGLDFSALMTDTAPPPAHIEIPSGEEYGGSGKSEDEEEDEGEDEESSGYSSDDGPQDKGKQIADASVEDVIIEDAAMEEVEQADTQRAIQQSLVDLTLPTAPSTAPPSVGESSSSQAPAPAPAPAPTPALNQPGSTPPSVEVTPQTEPSSVPASTSEGDPSSTQPATNSHST
ncbi:PREDICTED: actin cytoskeleton-regulatory complex protein PAN1-like [Nicotiana attenuata]|uniref:actin cytoskeleton-regulatory complex protein PAN1-like n=1 Tax=Nicotiana attenuata TaxID=49451 RepID=UPI000905C7FB|nr:PREDICTED: actin cytoskeleton-regulatory complex protein PAN1-like [Nicotiana attenuata]